MPERVGQRLEHDTIGTVEVPARAFGDIVKIGEEDFDRWVRPEDMLEPR